MRFRSDFRTAVTIMNRLHRESGEERAEPLFTNIKDDTLPPQVVHGGIGHVQKLLEILQEKFFHLRALQGHSGRNLVDPSLQDNCCFSGRFLQVHLARRMCNQFTLHHQFGIATWRSKFEHKTDSIFLLVDPMDKEHKDPETIDLEAPRLAQHMHTAWKKHQNTVYWVDINLAQKKGLKFYQTRSNAIILYNTLPANCIPKAFRDGN